MPTFAQARYDVERRGYYHVAVLIGPIQADAERRAARR